MEGKPFIPKEVIEKVYRQTMIFNWKIWGICAALISLFITCRAPEPNCRHELRSGTLISICELLKAVKAPENAPKSVIIRGKVTDLVWCPPCPKGAGCSICGREHMIIQDGGCSLTISGNWHNHFILQTDYCISLEKGEHYNEFPYHPYEITGWMKNPGSDCMPVEH